MTPECLVDGDTASDYNKNDENMCVTSSFANDDSCFDDVNDCTVGERCVLRFCGDDCDTTERLSDNSTEML